MSRQPRIAAVPGEEGVYVRRVSAAEMIRLQERMTKQSTVLSEVSLAFVSACNEDGSPYWESEEAALEADWATVHAVATAALTHNGAGTDAVEAAAGN